ncbi:glycosyltransferase [Bifidobacterium hapali]|uniref:Glycosyltransferase n=1 Tax=Bifidobacterium hapali TaxID=1630172 RepID=A0A261FWZ6_9BIFI|nr:hypothetical protein [Bifidobacterium hapali]OZG63638.1 glycosyltransferase [Bifidobacterium hapali]
MLHNIRTNRSRLRAAKPIIVAIAIIVVLELFFFNLPFWQTFRATPEQAHDDGVGSGLSIQADGTAKVTDTAQAWRDVSAKQAIEYLYLNHNSGESDGTQVKWSIATKKDTDGGWYYASAVVGYSPAAEHSRYSRVGNGATHVRLIYQTSQDAVIPYNDVTINPHVPMHFSPIRLILECAIAALIIMFRPRSGLYRIRLSAHRACVVPVLLVVLVQCAVLSSLLVVSDPGQSPDPAYSDAFGSYYFPGQYQAMAKSLLQGSVSLDLPVNPALEKMRNPYDTMSRIEVARNNPDVPVYFDVAYKDGKYYSYFGVLPVLTMFMPYRVITGSDMPTNTGVLIAGLLVTLAGALLCVQIARLVGRRRTVSLGSLLLAMTCIFLGNGVTILIQTGQLYQIPQEMGVACALLGLACWIEGKLKNLSKPYIALGSFFMALTAGCRPQLIFASFIALPLFWNEICTLWNDGLHSARGLLRGIGVWASAVLPYGVVLLPLFAYNAVRFGSPIDFGANYNLTGYDMPNSRAPLTQYFSYVFDYLLQPPQITASFPFINTVDIPLTTWRSIHPSFGGYFMSTAPFALLLCGAGLWRKQLRAVNMSGLFLGLVPSFIGIFLVSSRVTGIDYRYQVDFVWLIAVAVLILLFSIDAYLNPKESDVELNAVKTDSRIAAPRHCTEVSYGSVLQGGVFGFMAGSVALAAAFLFFKQFMADMPMPLSVWWDTASWFVFL